MEAARRQFAGLSHAGIELDDTGFDIGSYLETCRRVSHDHIFFLNTHSELIAPGWLSHIFTHAAREGRGLVGTMGSYESIFDTVRYLESVIRSSLTAKGELAERLAYYFDFILPRFRPDWYGVGSLGYGAGTVLRRLKALFRAKPRQPAEDPLQGLRGAALIWPGAPDLDFEQFPPFPNPHIRSNGFMVPRTRLLSSGVTGIVSKSDANAFESGRKSLTAQFRRAGLATIVVGADGRSYGVADWWRSGTFRLGEQLNLMISDNHTRAFTGMSKAAAIVQSRLTWGDYLGPAPDDFPKLGHEFCVGSLDP